MKNVLILFIFLFSLTTYADIESEILESCQKGYSQIDGVEITPSYLCVTKNHDEGAFACVSEAKNGLSVALVEGYLFSGKIGSRSYTDHERGDRKEGFTEDETSLNIYSSSFFGFKKTLDLVINKKDLTATLFSDDEDSDQKENYDLSCKVIN